MNLIGIVLPALIDLINRNILNKDTRFWVSAFICALFGVGINLIENNGYHYPTLLLAFDSFATSIMAMFGTAQLVYKAVYENSGIQFMIRGEEAMKQKDQT